MENYDDIINLPHYNPKNHQRMSMYARAAQFAPFAALTGYEDSIKETARLTNKRIDMSDELKIILNRKIKDIKNSIHNRPVVTITYFVPDDKKSGGKYVTITGTVKKVDEYSHSIILVDDTEILINEIIEFSVLS